MRFLAAALIAFLVSCGSNSSGSVDTACRRFADCQVQAYDQCVSEAANTSAELLACITHSSCAALAANTTDCPGKMTGGGGSCRDIQCSEGAAGDALCNDNGCGGGCFFGGCNSF